MARDLGDVLHYFIPEIEQPEPGDRPGERALEGRQGSPASRARDRALPVIAVPLGRRDVLRATFVWNLAVEMTAQGAVTTVVAPSRMMPPVWPDPGRNALGAEMMPVLAEGLGDLSRATLDVAVGQETDEAQASPVIVCVPPAWLGKAADGAAILRRVHLFTSPDPGEMIEAYALAKHLWTAARRAAVGVTIYGVQRVEVARRTFERLADTAHRHLGRELASYGLLVDELQIYRAIVERRPIGLAHPQSRAARSLRDVARLLLDDLTGSDDG